MVDADPQWARWRRKEVMKPSEVLVHEHEIICLVLDAAEREARKIKASGVVPVENVRSIMSFVREFADGSHHAKEEQHLFIQMQKCGMPAEQGPIAVMNHEHEMGRAYMRALGDSLGQVEKGDASAAGTVAESILGYVNLLRSHIYKENNILFPMADNMFSPDDQAELSGAFDEVDTAAAALRKKHIEFAHALAAQA